MGETGRFPAGDVLITPSAAAVLRQAGLSAVEIIDRHRHGDWGDLTAEASAANERALSIGGEIGSTYILAGGLECMVITDAAHHLTGIITVTDMPALLDLPFAEWAQQLRNADAAPVVDQPAANSSVA